MAYRKGQVTSHFMRCLKMVGAGAIIAAFGAISAGGASAAKLFLKSEGVVAPTGSALVVQLVVSPGACILEGEGKLDSNGKATDKMTFKGPFTADCENAGSISGAIKTVTLSSKLLSVYKASPKVTLTMPGPCVYDVSQFEGSFAIPGFTSLSGESRGKLNKGASERGCPKTEPVRFEAIVTNAIGFRSLYETELRA